MHILDTKAPGLADELRPLPIDQRRLILASACNFVSTQIGNLDFVVRDILSEGSKNLALTNEQISLASSLAERADDRYLTLQQAGAADAEWWHWFAEGRLLTALAMGFGGDDWTDTADAIYELCCSLKDPSELIALIRSRIRELFAQ